jgi:phage tail tube protein FII
MGVERREEGLRVEVVDGRLEITIGVEALATAVKAAPFMEDVEGRYAVGNPDALAASVAHYLEDEDEEGTTRVHRAIDSAAEQALEQGLDGFDEVEA